MQRVPHKKKLQLAHHVIKKATHRATSVKMNSRLA